MNDREQIIKDFEHSINKARGDYYDYVDLTVEDADEILKLLKEQEPVMLENQHKPYGNSLNANAPWISRCPKCGKKVEGKQTRYCKYCGQKVKWDD